MPLVYLWISCGNITLAPHLKFALVSADKSVDDIHQFPRMGTQSSSTRASPCGNLSHATVCLGWDPATRHNVMWQMHFRGRCWLWREMCNASLSSKAKCRPSEKETNKQTGFYSAVRNILTQTFKYLQIPQNSYAFDTHQGVNLLKKTLLELVAR